MEFPNAQHFATGINMRHKLSVVEFPWETYWSEGYVEIYQVGLSAFHIITSFMHIVSD